MRMVKGMFALLLLIVLPSVGMADIGIHLNFDFASVDEVTDEPVTLGESHTAEYSISDFTTPIGAGIEISGYTTDFLRLMTSIEMTYNTYHVSYADDVGGSGWNIEDDIPYYRMSIDLSALFAFYRLPKETKELNFLAGLGPSVVAQTDIFNEEGIVEQYDVSVAKTFLENVADDVNLRFGMHLALGTEYQPEGWEVGFRFLMKYYVMFNRDLSDRAVNNWFSIGLGMYVE